MIKKGYIIVLLPVLALVVWMILPRSKKSSPPPVQVQPAVNQSFTPAVPAWRPDQPVDINRIYEQARRYTQNKMQFAIFEHGTVVCFGFTMINIADKALSILHKIYLAPPVYKPAKMEDGNYMVEYSRPAFTIVFKDELDKNWTYINQHYREGLCKDETPPPSFDSTTKIGLYARAKMFMDAASPRVVKIFDPVGRPR